MVHKKLYPAFFAFVWCVEEVQAMDASLVALTSNTSNVSNDAYNQAKRHRDDLRNAEAAVDGATRTVETLQTQISSAKSAVWDSDAPAQANQASTTSTASLVTNTTTTTSVSPAVAATPSFLESKSQACSTDVAAPLEVELNQVEHVDAATSGASEALLFWRLSSTPLRPAEAAAAETSAEAPRLRVANLGDRLRISADKPIMVLLVHGKELPISFADISIPGEHSLSGRRADAEIQLVHLPADPAQSLAVALLLDSGDGDNVWLQHVTALPRAGEIAEVQGSDPMLMHPAFSRGVAGHYYRYNGRLLKSQCARVRPGSQQLA